MTAREIIDVQLESFFGTKFPQKIQRLVDEELTRGQWADGYDLAVSQQVISIEDAQKLLQIILAQNPHLRIDEDSLRQIVGEKLPQSAFAEVLWIVDESGSFALTDSLRVARLNGTSLAWRSPRISYDGIEFDSLTDGELCGRAWLLSSNYSPDARFVFDFETGELLEGKVVEF